MKTNAGASSTGVPERPIGVCAPSASIFSFGTNAVWRGVQTGPGATPLTRMPRSMSCCAIARVQFAMPAFDTAYSARDGEGWKPCTLEVVMIAEPGLRCGDAALVSQNSG